MKRDTLPALQATPRPAPQSQNMTVLPCEGSNACREGPARGAIQAPKDLNRAPDFTIAPIAWLPLALLFWGVIIYLGVAALHVSGVLS